jgi:diguanylate cyclase (GGDEF)-like protein
VLKSKRKRFQDKLRQISVRYEKKIFDLTQLIEISKSLNSTLDYNNLVESILFICMGQLKVLKAGLFARKDIDRQHLYLHRSMSGFELNPEVDYIIPEHHPLLHYFQNHFRAHNYQELVQACPSVLDLAALTSLEPYLIVPLRSKSSINGVLILDEPIGTTDISSEQRSYVLDIAHLAGIAVHNAFLYEITTTDMMTKLKLRHYMIDVLQDHLFQVRQGHYTLSAIMVDIDHFKKVNDSFGHSCGDAVIRQVAQVMLDNIRQTDVAARYGGEEFMLLLPESSIHSTVIIAERIRRSMSETLFAFNEQPISLTISLGVAELIPAIDTTTQGFIDRVDTAMYESKKSGRNRVTVAIANRAPVNELERLSSR